MTKKYVTAAEWTDSYDAENRLTEIEYQDGSITRFLYDGDGKRVARLNVDNEGTIYIGNYFESEYPYIEDTRPPLYLEPLIPVVSGLCEAETESCAYLPVLAREAELRPFPVKRGTSYYYADGQRIAMRTGSETYLLFGDHLASSILLVRGEGTVAEKAYYLPWGGTRGDETITSTAYAYTGQMREGDIYYYGARWPKVPEAKPKGFDPQLGRFMQADSIVPLQVQGTQAFDRYAYVNNNPLRFTDPSGHHIGVNYRMTDGGSDGYPVIIDYMLMRLEEDYQSLTKDYNAILATYGQYAYNHSGLLFYESVNVINSFLANSDYGKPYDLKQALNEFFFPGKKDQEKYTLIIDNYYRFDIWGNMYYGYMGARLGIPKEILLPGAGWAQQRNDNPVEIRNQKAFLYKKYDYPTDQAAISKGYYLWKEYKEIVTPQNVMDVLDVSLDRLSELP